MTVFNGGYEPDITTGLMHLHSVKQALFCISQHGGVLYWGYWQKFLRMFCSFFTYGNWICYNNFILDRALCWVVFD